MRPATYFILLMVMTQLSFAQEKLNHPIKHYTSEDGKLYWNKELPMYIFVADNPEGNKPQKLESENQAQFANPVFLDTEGVNWVRTRWAVNPETKQPVSPQTEVMFEVYRDGTAPTTTTKFTGANKYVSAGTTYYGKDLLVESQVFDKHAGLEKLYYSANASAYAEFPGSVAASKEGQNEFKFYGVDNVGNVEEEKTYSFTVDLTAPITSYALVGDQTGNVLSPRTMIELTSKDNLSGVSNTFYKFDDGNERRYYRNIPMTNLSEGEHTLTYFSKDNVGNMENAKTYKFFLDRSAPVVTKALDGHQFKRNGKVYIADETKINLSADDNKAGVDQILVKIDEGGLVAFNNFVQLPAKQGRHNLVYYAVDKVNNDYQSVQETVKKVSETYYVDVIAPTIGHKFTGSKYSSRDTVFITSNTQVELSASDIDAGVKEIGYKIDGGSNSIYEEAFTINQEGVHKVSYYSVDEVGNKKEDEFTFIVDNTGPEIESILSMETIGTLSLEENEDDLDVYSKGVKLYLGATDNVIDTEAIYYVLNDGREIKYNVPLELNAQGVVAYKIRAIDKLGNESISEVKQIFVK